MNQKALTIPEVTGSGVFELLQLCHLSSAEGWALTNASSAENLSRIQRELCYCICDGEYCEKKRYGH